MARLSRQGVAKLNLTNKLSHLTIPCGGREHVLDGQNGLATSDSPHFLFNFPESGTQTP